MASASRLGVDCDYQVSYSTEKLHFKECLDPFSIMLQGHLFDLFQKKYASKAGFQAHHKGRHPRKDERHVQRFHYILHDGLGNLGEAESRSAGTGKLCMSVILEARIFRPSKTPLQLKAKSY